MPITCEIFQSFDFGVSMVDGSIYKLAFYREKLFLQMVLFCYVTWDSNNTSKLGTVFTPDPKEHALEVMFHMDEINLLIHLLIE